jgi:hypothetical protein
MKKALQSNTTVAIKFAFIGFRISASLRLSLKNALFDSEHWRSETPAGQHSNISSMVSHALFVFWTAFRNRRRQPA